MTKYVLDEMEIYSNYKPKGTNFLKAFLVVIGTLIAIHFIVMSILTILINHY